MYENDYGYDTDNWYQEFTISADDSDPENTVTYLGVQTSSKSIHDLVTLHGDFALRALERYSDDDVQIVLDNNDLNSTAEVFTKHYNSDLYIPNFNAYDNLIFLWDHQFDEQAWEEQLAFSYNSDFTQTYIDLATENSNTKITLEGYFGLNENTVLLDDGARTSPASSADLKLFLNNLRNNDHDLSNSDNELVRNSLDNDLVSGETFTYVVTVSEGKYYVDGVLQDSLRLDAGNTYIFDYSSAAGHPLLFSTTPDGIHGGGSNYIDGVSDLGNNQLQIEVTENTPDLYYFCQNHSGMGGGAQVVSDIVTISENSDAGSTIGITAYAEEVDAGDSVSYALTNDAGGLFEIDSTTGVVTLSGTEEQLPATPISIRESFRFLTFR